MKSLQGQLLLATEQMRGNEFFQTVILVCWHNSQGAFGLTLNRPTDKTIKETLTVTVPNAIAGLPLFAGGPVSPEMLSLLYCEVLIDFNEPDAVIPGLRLRHTLDDLTNCPDSYLDSCKIKIFSGHAGWAPGQLDKEIKQEAWLTHPAKLDYVFDPQPRKLWKSILRSKGGQYRLLAETPKNISFN